MGHSWYDLFHDFAGPVATVIAATAAAVITWYFGRTQARIATSQAAIARKQVELAAVRLQHDLYDRRFAVYNAARTLLVQEIYVHGVASREAIYAFVRGAADAVFRLDDNLVDYLDEIRKRAFRLRFVADRLNDKDGVLPIGNERSVLAQKEADLTNWFLEQFNVLIEHFRPFLTLDRREGGTERDRLVCSLCGSRQVDMVVSRGK
jgi:hypothetical protein